MDNKDSKSIVGGVQSEGTFSSHICSVKGHTSAVVHAPGQNEEFKAETHNVSSSSSEEGSTTNLGSNSSEEEVASSVVAPLYSGSAPESLWSDVRQRDASGAETENEEESFRLVRRIPPSELELVRKIAEGGQAKIFSAMWLKTRRVVVKRYKNPNVNVADLQRQMEMVMKALKGTSMCGLCKVYGVSKDKKGKALLVMPHMHCDLQELINQKAMYNYDIYHIMQGIAKGLKNLHACGRIHKDVKSGNILVIVKKSFFRHPGPVRWVVRPWGPKKHGDSWHLSRFENGREISWCTKVNAYIGDYESVDDVDGTGFYRAPEVLKALEYGSLEDLKLAYSPAVDVYGFGMVLYELLTGRIPFEGHPKSDYDLVISGQRPDIPDDVTPKMRDLLLRCWHQDPHQRPSWTQIEKYLS